MQDFFVIFFTNFLLDLAQYYPKYRENPIFLRISILFSRMFHVKPFLLLIATHGDTYRFLLDLIMLSGRSGRSPLQ